MAGREALGGFAALLIGVAALTACERSPAPPGPPATAVTSSATTQAASSEATTTTASTGTTTGQTSTGGGGGGGTSTGGTSGGGAIGSPIDVPTIPDPHTSMDGLQPAIEGAFIAACGDDTLCVHLEYTDGACLLGFSPSSTAPRGSTVTVLTESQEACDEANNATTEPTGGSTDEPTDGTSTDDSSGGATDGSTSSPATGLGSGP